MLVRLKTLFTNTKCKVHEHFIILTQLNSLRFKDR